MNVKIEVKIKMKNGKEVTLNNDDARELYFRLKDIYDHPVITITPYVPTIYPFWSSSTGTISCNATVE